MDLDSRRTPVRSQARNDAPARPSREPAIDDPTTTRFLPSPTAGFVEDERVVQALEEYLSLTERGRPPRLDDFLRQHEEIAGDLEECLRSLECLQRAAPHFETISIESNGSLIPGMLQARFPSRLGDYRLIREIGHGGMGVVFEAEQISLDRRVALKLLPFSMAADPRQLQRFQFEVQAAAHLSHAHIVSIHGVGCEDGTHYYAMQLIDGESLGAIIKVLAQRAVPGTEPDRTYESFHGDPARLDDLIRWFDREGPAYHERVAKLGIQAAEALDHAHGLGVVHRDIKPANLLIDRRRHLWITDFGLAQRQGDSGLTVTGDLVGTLRYMSPEQARAKRGIVDHRTDIYSLGATLYELVAFRPAFQGASVTALVQQVCHEEPVSPRRINPTVPRDLETIILKAMAKEPEHRYATAQELAADLERFAAGRPILVRPPSIPDRVARWARRHRVMVLSCGLALVLACVCMSISTYLIWQAMTRTEQVAMARAVELERARANLELAHRSLDLCLNSAESWIPRDPDHDPADNMLLKTALTFYEQIASRNANEPYVQLQTFGAYRRVGDIRVALGDALGANDAYRKALATMVVLREGDPRNDELRVAMAEILQKYGSLLRTNAIYSPAEWSAKEAVRLLEEVLAHAPRSPKTRHALARALIQLAGLKGETGRIEPALSESQRALGLLHSLLEIEAGVPIDPLEIKKDLASVYNSLGKWLQLDGKLSKSEESYRKALEVFTELRGSLPGVRDTRESLALCQGMLGELLRSMGRNDESEPLITHAIQGLEDLAEDFPQIPRYRHHLARLQLVMSNLYWATDRSEQAVTARQRAMALDPKLQSGQHVRLNNLAWYLLTSPDEEARNPSKGLELARKAVNLIPNRWESWNTLGVACYRNNDLTGAREALTTARARRPGDNAYDGFFLAMTLWRMGQQTEGKVQLARSERWRLRYRPGDVELLRFRNEAERLLGPIDGLLAQGPPLTPSSVAEALQDSTFGLPLPQNVEGEMLTKEAEAVEDFLDPTPKAGISLRDSDLVDQTLYFMDLG